MAKCVQLRGLNCCVSVPVSILLIKSINVKGKHKMLKILLLYPLKGRFIKLYALLYIPRDNVVKPTFSDDSEGIQMIQNYIFYFPNRSYFIGASKT